MINDETVKEIEEKRQAYLKRENLEEKRKDEEKLASIARVDRKYLWIKFIYAVIKQSINNVENELGVYTNIMLNDLQLELETYMMENLVGYQEIDNNTFDRSIIDLQIINNPRMSLFDKLIDITFENTDLLMNTL